MDTEQLKKLEQHYEVLKDVSLFDGEVKAGSMFSREIIQSEFESAFLESGLDSSEHAIPKTFINFCLLHDGFSTKWRYRPPGKPNSRVMGFVHFSRAYEFIEHHIKHEGKTLFLFDNFLDKWKVYIELTDKENVHRLFYHDQYEKKIYSMRIDIDQYFEKAALCRGLTNWHELFFEDRNYESDKGNRITFREEMDNVFPGVNFDDFVWTD